MSGMNGTNGTKTRESRGRAALCLLFAVLLAALWGTAAPGEAAPFLNAAGNALRPLAVDPLDMEGGYSAILYNNKNGLPSSEANVMAQTGDGFLWIGSYAGLIRYDGRSFELTGSESGISNVRCLYVDSLDRLWIGTNDTGLFLMNRGEMRNWSREDGLPSMSIRSVTEGADGLIYVAGTMGTGVIDASFRYAAAAEEDLSGQLVNEVRCGGDGLVYGVTGTGTLFALREGKPVSLVTTEEWPFEEPASILPDPEHPGLLYVGTEHNVYHGSLMAGEWDRWEQWDVSPLAGMERMEIIEGRLWICSRTGIGRLEDGEIRLLKNIPMNNSFEQIMTDSEGNLWIVSTRQGVMKIVANRFTDLFARCGLEPEVVNSTCLADGLLYIGTESGLIVAEEDGGILDSLPVRQAFTADGEAIEADDLLSFLDGIRIRSINRDSAGRLWISTGRVRGLLRLDGETLTQFTVRDGLLSEAVRFVSECEDGSILVSTNNGFSRILGDRVVESYGEKEGLAVRMILTMVEGFRHEIVAGSDGGGIYIVDGGEIRAIGAGDGLTSEVIMRIRRSRAGDGYWIVTSNSLARMTPDYRVETLWEFSNANNFDLYENNRGDLWVMGSGGIYVLPAGTWDGEGPVEPVYFGIPDGLPYVDTANSYSELTPEGILYMAGNEGVVKINLEAPLGYTGEIRLTVPYIDADGLRVYPDASGRFTLPGNTLRATIYPYVLNYSLFNPRVSYRLDGFDRGDTTLTRSDLAPVHYTNLFNGTYHFVMSVRDPVARTDRTASFEIIKGKPSSVGNVGSVIMDVTALFYMGGLLIYTALYRRRGRLDDRLFFAMIIVNIILTAVDAITYLVDGSGFDFTGWVMLVGNLLFFAAFEIFPYLYMLYLDYRAHQDEARIRRIWPWYAIPCALILALLLVNLFTGWIYYVDGNGVYQSGPLNDLIFVPVGFYFLVSLIRVRKIDRRLVYLGILLVATRVAWGIWFRDISSTALIYTLFLVCTHIHVMNRPLSEEKP